MPANHLEELTYLHTLLSPLYLSTATKQPSRYDPHLLERPDDTKSYDRLCVGGVLDLSFDRLLASLKRGAEFDRVPIRFPYTVHAER